MSAAAATVVTVRFFASLREAMERDAMQLTLAEPSLAGLRRQLAQCLTKVQAAALETEGVQIAVNQTIVQGDADLTAGDEIAFLPPVTGG